MTFAPDHRTGHVTLACRCGSTLELPPRAAEAARPLWESLHRGPRHGPADPAEAREAAGNSEFEQVIAIAERCRGSR